MIRKKKLGSSPQAIKKLIGRLMQEGATAARLINVSDIIVDERVRLKCRVPLCNTYGRNLMCPPNVMAVSEFRLALAGYDHAVILQVSAALSDSEGDPYSAAVRLHELVNTGEREAFESGFRFAAGFIGGCCRLCRKCVAETSGRKCRHPFRARPSMEAMGIDVLATAGRAGLNFKFPVKDTVTWTGLILI